MNSLHKSWALFLLGCMVVRTGLTVLAYYLDPAWLCIMGIFAVLLVLSWLRIMLWAPRNTGPEVFNGKIWWQSHRVVHVINYTVFAVLAFMSSSYSWIPLGADTLLGLLFFLHHHVGSF